MRLLNTRSWEMREFISDDDVPPYAILSHTWEEEEVSFQQWENRNSQDISQLKGYKKITRFGEVARSKDFEWIWIDTCCIDKKSSAELSEAINAMFRWYKNATICYAYLADVRFPDNDPYSPTTESRIRESRWFTRGWTLQELIAPRDIEFYSSTWELIATKLEPYFDELLSSITTIDVGVLRGRVDLAGVSIARKMSWASRRMTSRLEDMAYCLLGVFDVNIPLIYGEGRKAFQRLQTAIMDSSGHDQSLFAWGSRIVDDVKDLSHGVIDEDQRFGLKKIPWKGKWERSPLLGLLAESPADFAKSAEIAPVDHGYIHFMTRRNPPKMVNGGVLLDLIVRNRYNSVSYWDQKLTGGSSTWARVTQPEEVELAILLCRIGNQGSRLVGLIIHSWGDGYSSRTNELVSVDQFVSQCRFDEWNRTKHLVPHQPFQLRHRDIILRRWMSSFRNTEMHRPVIASGPAWRQKWGDRILRMEEEAEGDEEVTFFFPCHITKSGGGVAITFKRLPLTSEELEQAGQSPFGGKNEFVLPQMGSLVVGASRYAANGSVSSDGLNWSKQTSLHGRPFNQPEHHRIMQPPMDTWELELDGWPRIYVRAERITLGVIDARAVDVVDFFMYPDGETARRAKNSVWTPR